MMSGQISPWQLASSKEGPSNLPVKFGQNWVSNSWDIVGVEFPVVVVIVFDVVGLVIGVVVVIILCQWNLLLKFGQNWVNNK